MSNSDNEVIYFNGNVYTSGSPEIVSAFVVADGKFIDIGESEEILKKYDHIKERVDLNGKTVVPGFIDAHGHLIDFGVDETNAKLESCRSMEDVLNALEPFYLKCKEENKWLIGVGWDQFYFPDKKFPTAKDLDERFPDVPISLDRIDYHAVWVNSCALKIIGELPSKDPDGGKIVRDEDGNPTGIFIDNAMEIVDAHIPNKTLDELYSALQLATRICNSYGLTSVHYPGVSKDHIEVIKQSIKKDELNIRVYAMLKDDKDIDIDEWCKNGLLINYNDSYKFTLRSVKIFMDGALGSRGAALIEPYSDDPNEKGLVLLDESYYKERTKKWINGGFQVCTHAIGDRANRIVVEVYDEVIHELNKENEDLRLRVEHAQIVHKDDFAKFKKNNIIASVEPTHGTSDMRYAEKRLGPERILGAYAWKTFLNNGVKLALGSDFPVESPNPLLGFYAAITRKDLEGYPEGGWYPEERLTREEALKGFTIDAAYAAFEETLLGSIEPNKLADFVILSDDIMKIDEKLIPKVKVLKTYVGGRKVFDINDSNP